MKKLALFLSVVLSLTFIQCSGETIEHNVDSLPDNAKIMISNYFDSAVSLVKIEKKTFGGKEYDVVLTDGTQISFDGNGEWEEIDTPNNISVPSAIIPGNIKTFVAQKHAGALIVGIEKTKKGYSVDLSNGNEIEFTTAGGFLKYD